MQPPPEAEPAAPRPRRLARRLAPYAAVLAVTLAAMTLTLVLWRADLRAPFDYSGDALQHVMFTKAFLENGWYLRNPGLGAPGEMEMYDFPAADTLPGLLIKGLGLFSHDPFLVTNLFFLATFPLASLGAFFVCRRLGLSGGPAALAGVLYAFLPYHFYRSVGHLYLSAYFVVPPAILVAWWVATGRLLARGGGGWRRVLGAAAICGVVSTAGVYYPFFAGIILGTASLLALCARGDWRHGAAGLALVALLAGGMLACLVPTLAHLPGHTRNLVSKRGLGESETYGLKIVQLLLPAEGHRLKALRHYRQYYDARAPLVSENSFAALGLIGAGGFVLLVGWLLLRPLARPAAPDAPDAPDADPAPARPGLRETLDTLGVLNAAALLYATIGGLGVVFAEFVSPQVRALNRMSVFIAFFALAAAAAVLDHFVVRRRAWPLPARVLGWAGLGLLLGAGIFDQSPVPHSALYPVMRHEYHADREYYRQVEAALPAGAMVFEFPYTPFPENGPVNQMGEYTLFCGYIETHGLRWSYGALKGSPTDLWQQRLSTLPPEEAVRTLAAAGFGGITLERDGYADDGAALEAALRRLLGPPAAWRRRRLFFSLEEYARARRASMSPEAWRQEADRALHAPFAQFGAGFTGPEFAPGRVWYWCGRESEITLHNTSPAPRRARLQMLAHTGPRVPAHLTMQAAGGVSQTWTIDANPQALAAELDVPPGALRVRFSCDGQPIDAPQDERSMVWSAVNFQVNEVPPPPAAPAP